MRTAADATHVKSQPSKSILVDIMVEDLEEASQYRARLGGLIGRLAEKEEAPLFIPVAEIKWHNRVDFAPRVSLEVQSSGQKGSTP